MTHRLALTVGPVLYHWPRNRLMQFYADMADSPADTLVLGEVVCARRRELRLDDWLALARELAQTGKRIVLATQALIETEADLRLIERQGEQSEFAVEAGDASALQLLARRVPLVLGPHLNIYSRAALVEHAGLGHTGSAEAGSGQAGLGDGGAGVTHWVAPVELALDAIAAVNPPTNRVTTPAGVPVFTEAWAFGRVPLSMSARCFTARHHGLPKDQCGYKCLAGGDGKGDGLAMLSSDAQPFLVLNGTQTQSAGVHCLLGDGAALRQAGVQSLRLSPCDQGFGQVLRDFDAVMNQGLPDTNAVAAALQGWPALGVPGPLSNGYARHRPGMEWSNA